MKLTKKTEKVTTYRTETYSLCKGINLRVNYTDGEIVGQTIPCKFKDVYEFSYVKDIDAFKAECKSRLFYQELGKDYWWRKHLITNLLEEFQTNGFDESRLVAIKGYDHTILDKNGDCFDILVQSNYIGGFIQRSEDSDWSVKWDWEALKKHLKKHPDIVKFEVEEIPYYNSEFYGQEGLTLDVVFKGEWRKTTRDNGYCDKNNIITGQTELDPFNVKQFILK